LNNITHIDSHLKRRDIFFYPPGVRSLVEIIGMPKPGEAYGYSLGRRKKGVEIFLFFDGGLRLNISIQLKHYPKTFKKARLYMLDVQRRFNLNLDELDCKGNLMGEK